MITAEALAQKYEVSVRTIYRDIRALEEGGVPIGAEAGIGYYIMEGYHLPPVMFTHEEARALLMAGKIIEKMSDERTSKAFGEALTKISAVLDSSKKEELEDLEQKIIVQPFPFSAQIAADPVLDKIKEALIKTVKVSFDYKASGKDEANSRTVDPIGLCYYGHTWHLIAFCHLRKDYRDFRTDRISQFNVLHERFKASTHPSLQQYIDQLTSNTELIKTRIKVHHTSARYMSNTKHQMGFLQEEKQGEYYRMEFATYGLHYFAKWLFMYGKDVEIEEPYELKVTAKKLVGELSVHYQS